jgi:hypothetical protein
MTVRVKGGSRAVVEHPPFRIEGQRRLVVKNGSLPITLQIPDVADAAVCKRKIRFAPQGFLIFTDGRVQPSLLLIGNAQVVVCIRKREGSRITAFS